MQSIVVKWNKTQTIICIDIDRADYLSSFECDEILRAYADKYAFDINKLSYVLVDRVPDPRS